MIHNPPRQLCYVVNVSMQEAFFGTMDWAMSYIGNWPDCDITIRSVKISDNDVEFRKFEVIRTDFLNIETLGGVR